MMKESPYAKVHVGRLDEGQMREFLAAVSDDMESADVVPLSDDLSPGELPGKEPNVSKDQGAKKTIVVDATHPYATEVTGNIKSAAQSLGISYYRLLRSSAGDPEGAVFHFDSIEKCTSVLDETSGNILLTTGSKELEKYCLHVSEKTRARTYVRVLPSEESLRLCAASGIEPSHIIAMQGPFSRDMNEAILRQYNIEHLITKESGRTGGFDEKKEAALSAGACLYVIDRPNDEEGISLQEILGVILGKDISLLQEKQGTDEDESKAPGVIYIIGVGMGTEQSLTLDAKNALAVCESVFGAPRILKNIACPVKYELYLAGDIIPILEEKKLKRAAILFSGDTGFYSGATAMIRELRKWRSDLDIRVIPGISSVSALAARLGENYDGAELCSIHGRRTEKVVHDLLEKIRYNRKVFVLLSGTGDIPEIAARLKKSRIDARITAGLNLWCKSEQIKEMTVDEAIEYEADGIVIALIQNQSPERRLLLDLKRDSEFRRGNVPMTKECIRHESIIRLGLREGDTFIDVGGGTGSVAIEAAGLHSSLMVYTIERKPDAVQLIRENIKEADLGNITVIEGRAEDVLDNLPAPDCVFIGGSGGELEEIMKILISKKKGIRYVINAVSLETIEAVRKVIREYGASDAESIMIQVTDVREAGSHHMLSANNPVWIFSFIL